MDSSPLGQNDSEMIVLRVRRGDAALLVDGLQSLEYWDLATELDLPRRNGQVFLPEDDQSWWGEVAADSDEECAIEQIRGLRSLAAWVESQISEE